MCACVFTSPPLLRQIEACLTSICNSPVCVFPALFVLAGLCYQEHFGMPEMGFGVEESFQRFFFIFLTFTPMFFLRIKLLGGPSDCFFPDHLQEKCGRGDNGAKIFIFFLLFKISKSL